MRQSALRLARPGVIVCAAALTFNLVPAPVWAAEPGPAVTLDRPAPLRDAVRRVAAEQGHRLEPKAARQAQAPSSGETDLRSGSFFRRPVGIAVLAAFGVGVGYAVYSASNDRIRSSGR